MPIFAAIIDLYLFFGCLAIGASVGVAIWWVLTALRADDVEQEDEWRYDISRINALRQLDAAYRIFGVLIGFLAKLNRSAFREKLPEIQREILAAGLPRYWLPEEYLGRAQLIGLLMLPAYLFFCIRWSGSIAVGTMAAVGFSVGTAWLLRRRLTSMAKRRILMIKRRMPFLLDLLTLLMEAGSSFLQALKQAVKEFEGHPVSNEFGRVLTDMNMGRARTEAFNNLRDRLSDDEINGIVGSIIQSEELGTPLSNIFRTQADVLRVRRSQRAETIAGEAAVNMLLPGVLVMAATVLIILGPFILNYLFSGFGI